MTAVSIFDVDRTLTRRPTYSAFLAYAAMRSRPWRLVLLPLLVPFAAAYAAGLISRKRMKEAMHWTALGRRLERGRAGALAEAFAARLFNHGLYADARETIEAERREGRLIVLATAAPELYIAPLARLIGADAVLASGTTWTETCLVPRIAGENCYGAEKFDTISAWAASHGIPREQMHVRFFSDHASDLPTFEWADDPVMVNPSARLRGIGLRRGWRLLDWNAAQG